MNNKKFLAVALIATGVVAFGATSVMASTKIGTVTGRDGDVKDLLSVNAKVDEVNGSHITFTDTDSGKSYESSFGPSWYTKTYGVGEEVTIEMVETSGENANGHTAQVLKVGNTALREDFEGKPLWAGTRNAEGSGMQNKGASRNGNFVDANSDGICDNAQ